VYNRFDRLATLLEEFIKKYVLNSAERAQEVGASLPDVLSKCDEISYEQLGQVPAYVILYFLDRYHRFQLLLHELIRQRLLPLPKTLVNVLGVGTGPAPALFALSVHMILSENSVKKEVSGDWTESNMSLIMCKRSINPIFTRIFSCCICIASIRKEANICR